MNGESGATLNLTSPKLLEIQSYFYDPEKLTRTEGFLQVSKASEEKKLKGSRPILTRAWTWELDKHNKPHPSDTSGRTNADKNCAALI